MKKSVHVFVDQQGNQLEYGSYGTGSNTLICFPGFGETHESFENLSTHLPDYTVVAINLYFSGRSQRHSSDRYLRQDKWETTFSEFLADLRVDRFSVLGYSLGGRFAISTFCAFESRIDHLILVAADGIIQRFTYQLATFPVIMRQLFYAFMSYPQPFFMTIALLQRLNLVNSFTAKFVLSQLSKREDRMRVYHSWVTFKFLRVSPKELKERLNTTESKTTLIFGKKDRIIDPKKHFHFLSQLKKSQVLILPFGHNKLVDNAIDQISETLNSLKR